MQSANQEPQTLEVAVRAVQNAPKVGQTLITLTFTVISTVTVDDVDDDDHWAYNFPVNELKEICKSNRIATSGTKKDLVERLKKRYFLLRISIM